MATESYPSIDTPNLGVKNSFLDGLNSDAEAQKWASETNRSWMVEQRSTEASLWLTLSSRPDRDMPRSHGHKKIPILFIPLIFLGMAAAASPDPRLLSLVPPDAAIVAGISASSIQGQPDNFVLVTHNNSVDLEDFFALTGADDKRVIHQIVFVAAANNAGHLDEHSLLVSGRFDQPHLFKSATDRGAALTNYGSIPVLEIQPLARERDTFREVRWLAVLDSSVVVFGSVASTRVELDRYVAHAQADKSLLRRLARLRRKDQTWSILSASVRTLSIFDRDQEIHDELAKLNPELAELVQFGNELEFGLHYGRRVEFEYAVNFASTAADQVGPDPFRQSPVEPTLSASLLPTLETAVYGNSLHGVIAVSMSRYKTWLSEVSARGFDRRMLRPHSSEKHHSSLPTVQFDHNCIRNLQETVPRDKQSSRFDVKESRSSQQHPMLEQSRLRLDCSVS
jgi:hypothetical protein